MKLTIGGSLPYAGLNDPCFLMSVKGIEFILE